jgi:hypothetical protein
MSSIHARKSDLRERSLFSLTEKGRRMAVWKNVMGKISKIS